MTEARRMSAEARDFANKNTERAMRVAGDGITWWRNIAEQNLNQGRAVLEGCLSTTRMAMDSIDHQASDIRERSMSLAETMLTNAFDFARGVFHIKEPHELVQLQSEFLGRQAQAVVDQSRDLGETLAARAQETSSALQKEASRRRSEAA